MLTFVSSALSKCLVSLCTPNILVNAMFHQALPGETSGKRAVFLPITVYCRAYAPTCLMCDLKKKNDCKVYTGSINFSILTLKYQALPPFSTHAKRTVGSKWQVLKKPHLMKNGPLRRLQIMCSLK